MNDEPGAIPTAEPPRGPLAGIAVVDLTQVLAGPYCTMLLGDLGADVIKIEPLGGDVSRRVGRQSVDGHNVYFASLNRNKRSVHIDLTTEEGQAQLGRELAGIGQCCRRPADDDGSGVEKDSGRRKLDVRRGAVHVDAHAERGLRHPVWRCLS